MGYRYEELDYISAQVAPLVLEQLRANSQGVSELELVTDMTGINSLPALKRVGGVEKVVEAPLKLLNVPIDNAVEECREASDDARAAAEEARIVGGNVEELKQTVATAVERAEAATIATNEAIAGANAAADSATSATQTAQQAAASAESAAANAEASTQGANAQAEYAKTQGDYAKEQAAKISAKIGTPGGVAELDESGHVPSSQLPSYVDDVVEYPSRPQFPSVGEAGKIYVALDTNLAYRWGGTEYVEISPSLALGTTSSTAFAGDRGTALETKVSNIEDGTTAVARANSAATADSATTAAEATHATTADSAATADKATHAATADSATTADSAATADSATTAAEATHATTADSAATADEATHAATADSSATAGEAAHITDQNGGNGAKGLWTGTAEQYAALAARDANVIYVVIK